MFTLHDVNELACSYFTNLINSFAVEELFNITTLFVDVQYTLPIAAVKML